VGSKFKDYSNKIYLGDVKELLRKIPDNSVDMVFGDPDYNVGIKYEGKSYSKNFNEYVEWYIDIIKDSMRVLKESGNLFTINYPKQNAHLRVKYLDEAFPYVHDYAWVYPTNVGHSPKRFTTAHRSILHVRKSKDNKFYKNQIAVPYKNPTDRRVSKLIKNGAKGRMPYSWFEFNLVKNVSKEKTIHSCQIPQSLTEMLIKSCTKKGDTVLVLFAGSGAELEVCQKLGRDFISAELIKQYHEMAMDRLRTGKIEKKYKLVNGKRSKKNT
jgi:DNA modification methylase